MSQSAPRDAGTVPVRVQVIDPSPRVVDLVVPTYLKADDLTQRIARDAGLGAWWEDGTRRRFWLRARGRLLDGQERLADLGVVPYELIHLLPEPPPGAPVVERPLGIDPRPAPGSAWRWVVRLGMVVAFATLWTLGAWSTPHAQVAFWPAVALSWWVGRALPEVDQERLWSYGWRWCIGWLIVSVPAWVVGAQAAAAEGSSLSFVSLAALGGVVGGFLGYLARLGPVAALHVADVSAAEPGALVVAAGSCGICAGTMDSAHTSICPYGCGRGFHAGCLRARQSSAATSDACEMCGAMVGRRASSV